MYTTKKLAVALAGALVLVPMLAATVTGNSRSDYTVSGFDDYCNAFDSDGVGSTPPTGESDSCDADTADTTVSATFNGGVLADCEEVGAAGTSTICTGGISVSADPAIGSLGLDSPVVTSVGIDLSATGGWQFRACTTDTATNADLGCTLGTVVCLTAGAGAEYVITVGGGGTQAASDPAAGTIDSVIGWRTSIIGCNTTGLATPVTVTVSWTYDENVDPLTATAASVTTPTITPNAFPPGTCSVTWAGSASGASTYSEAEVLYSSGNSAQEDYTLVTGPGATATASDATGINTNFVGQDAEVSAQVWSWGEAPATAGPATATSPNTCELAAAGDIVDAVLDLLAGLTEPACALVVVDNTPVVDNVCVVSPTYSCVAGQTTEMLALSTDGEASASITCGTGVVAQTDALALVPEVLDIRQDVQVAGTYGCNLSATGTLAVALCINVPLV